MMSKFWEKIRDKEIWKIAMMVVLLFIITIWSGYTIQTSWGSIYKSNPNDIVNLKMTKIKAQTNYSMDMKTCLLSDLSNLYEDRLIQYCRENNANVSQDRIANDVRYYKLIIIAMSDVCENITVERYIHNNDLYRYVNKADWDAFKANVVSLYLREGRQIMAYYYDNTKVIMPLQEWLKREGPELVRVMSGNTDKLMEDLKTESVIYYTSINGKK
jgi:hypothetical protein